MARLIDADAFIQEHCADCKYFRVNGICTHDDPVCGSAQIVAELPTIDAVEVVHGRWVDRYGGKYANPVYDCSVCGKTAPRRNTMDVLGNWRTEQFFANYCPNCGAKMDGERRTDNA